METEDYRATIKSLYAKVAIRDQAIENCKSE